MGKIKTRTEGRGYCLFLMACLTSLIIVSCSHNTVLDEGREFYRNVWNRFTPEAFTVNIGNAENYYNIDVTVAVDTLHYRYREVPLAITLTSPDGEQRRFTTAVQLQDKGRWRGEMQDGYRVATARVRSYFSFNRKGEHRMEVGQLTSQYDLEGIHGIHVCIEKAKIDYSHLD